MTTFSQVKDYALTNLPGLCIGIETDGSHIGTVNWVAELLRRINYCPASIDLGDTHRGWHFRLVNPIKDPKAALRTYKQFANAMNADMLDKVLQHLQHRVASGSGAAPAMVAYMPPEPVVEEDSGIDPDAPLVSTLDDAMQINGVQAGGGLLRKATVWDAAAGKIKVAQVPDETIDAVVDRLLAVAALDDEQWGAW